MAQKPQLCRKWCYCVTSRDSLNAWRRSCCYAEEPRSTWRQSCYRAEEPRSPQRLYRSRSLSFLLFFILLFLFYKAKKRSIAAPFLFLSTVYYFLSNFQVLLLLSGFVSFKLFMPSPIHDTSGFSLPSMFTSPLPASSGPFPINGVVRT